METIRQEGEEMINLLRHIWNSSLKSLVAEFRLKLSGVTGASAEEERLRGASRYISGETSLLGKPIKYVDAPSYLFMRGEIFQSEIYRFKCSSPKPYIIDCGANIGLSVIYFKNLYPDCTLLCFEPDGKVFNILRENVTTFGLQGVTLHNKALWGREATVPFIQEGADGGRIDAGMS